MSQATGPDESLPHVADRGVSKAATEPTHRTQTCPACGATAHARFCGNCGFQVIDDSKGESVPWPMPGATLAGPPPVVLKQRMASPEGARRYLGVAEDGRYEIFVVDARDSHGAMAERRAAHETLPDLSLPPERSVSTTELRYALVRFPPGVGRLSEALADLCDVDDDEFDAIHAVRRLIVPLARTFAALHARGIFLGGADPEELLIGKTQTHFLTPPIPFRSTNGALPPGPRTAIRGFSPPEIYGHCTGYVDTRTDVFFIGMALYYTLSRIPPLDETQEALDRIPSPVVYRDGLPADLVGVVLRATSPVPSRRYPDARSLLTALEIALASAEQRRTVAKRVLHVNVGHELHIGVLKGQYAPQNQDDLFVAYDGRVGAGLFVISDGVSISEHGTGDLASACVRAEAHRLWQSLPRAEVENHAPYPLLPDGETQREALLLGVLNNANQRIADLIHRKMPRFLGPPEGIMAATAVMVLLDGNDALLCSIGDSRIYLIRDGHITSLLSYHDLASQLIRMRRAAPRIARAAPAAAALIRCVGEFDKDDDDQLIPVPLQPEFRRLRLLPGDQLVLCSDGIPDYAGYDEEHAEARMCQMVEQAPGAQWAAFELMVLANRGGGGDNISCIVLRFDEP
ncbi:MAG: serine/threonine protein phosphatase PrpC, partial [Bradymonadia bacterium]